MNYQDLYNKICKKVPSEYSLSWDNDGDMVCTDPKSEIRKILICLDVTLDAIDYAGKNGFDLIISHHPLIFKPLRSLTPNNITGKRLCKILGYGLSVMSFHTRLDATDVNLALAEALELRDISEFYIDASPLGRIGTLDDKMTVSQFAAFIKEKLDAPYVEYPSIEREISKVAVLGGSGGDAISEALTLGADCLVTGECGYNRAIDSAEMGLPVFVAGHFHTENPVCRKIQSIVEDMDGAFECEIYSSYIFKTI